MKSGAGQPGHVPGERRRAGALPSLRIGRTATGIVVSLGGRCDAANLDMVERVLTDLVDGQGNRAVSVHARGLRAEAREVQRLFARVAARARARGAHFNLAGGPAPADLPPDAWSTRCEDTDARSA